MAKKYLGLGSSGKILYIESINSSAGSGDADKIVSTDSSGRLGNSLLPSGAGQASQMFVATEAIEANKMINIYFGVHESTGKNLCRKADNSNNRPIHGYVKEAYAENASAEVFFDGVINFGATFTPGNKGFLGIDGSVLTTSLDPDTTTGKTFQVAGTFVDDDAMLFDPGEPIQL